MFAILVLQLIEEGGRLGAHLELVIFVAALVLLVIAVKKIYDSRLQKRKELTAVASILALYALFALTNSTGAFPNYIIMKWTHAIMLFLAAIVLYKITIKKK